MKIVTFAFIFLACFASMVDNIACVGHEFQAGKAVSYVAKSGTNDQINQPKSLPFDYCGICSHLCSTRNMICIADYDSVIVFSSFLLSDNNFIYTNLNLSTFLSSTERPPAIS